MRTAKEKNCGWTWGTPLTDRYISMGRRIHSDWHYVSNFGCLLICCCKKTLGMNTNHFLHLGTRENIFLGNSEYFIYHSHSAVIVLYLVTPSQEYLNHPTIIITFNIHKTKLQDISKWELLHISMYNISKYQPLEKYIQINMQLALKLECRTAAAATKCFPCYFKLSPLLSLNAQNPF